MSNQHPKISVIIPTYNSQDIISDCIQALESQTLPREMYEIIVVDDGSIDDTLKVVRSFEGVRCVAIPHGGPASARNAGAREARGEIIAFTDSDCTPTPSWVEQITAPFDNKDVIGAKGVYCTSQKGLVPKFVQLEYEFKYERMARLPSIDFIDTYSAAYRRKPFLENGGFDTSFPLPSVEDQELSFRLAQKGYLMVFAPKAEVYHRHDRNLEEYWRRKFGIGYWKAYMLRWLPQKTFSDSHTSPFQRIQIGLLAFASLSFLMGMIAPGFLWVGAILVALIFVTGLPFWRYVIQKDLCIGLFFPGFLVTRTAALGAGIFVGFIAPPQKVRHSTLSMPIDVFFVKRLIDIAGAIAGLTLSLPLILIAAIAIRLDTPGPVFFVQVRAGENGKPFRMIKLRTMVNGAESKVHEVIGMNGLLGPVYKVRSDSRRTKVGKFLRRWSIDEIPQFWNVLQGNMSLVGPRPEELWVVEQYNDEQRHRLLFKPGITGPVQVNGRGDLDFDERFQLEMDYMIHHSIGKDIHILVKTITAVLKGEGAY